MSLRFLRLKDIIWANFGVLRVPAAALLEDDEVLFACNIEIIDAIIYKILLQFVAACDATRTAQCRRQTSGCAARDARTTGP